MNIYTYVFWESAAIAVSMVESAKLFFVVFFSSVANQLCSIVYIFTTAVTVYVFCGDFIILF